MPRPRIDFDEEKHKYLIEGEEYPSVTYILGLTTPKNLGWWGMEVGVAGVAILMRRGVLPRPYDPTVVTQRLQEQRLTTNDIFWKRGESGTAIHKAFEDYGRTGKIPVLDDFPPEDHFRIQNLAAFLLDNRPEFLEQEVQTASLEHRYAGTFDARLKFHAGQYQGKECLVDVKTGKHVYPESQFPQLEAYEHAEIEAGIAPTDYRLVLHLPVATPYTLTPSLDSFDDFLVLMEHWKSVMERRKRLIAYKKQQKKSGYGVFV